MKKISIRFAQESEKMILEELQRRASLNNIGDREAILENPGAISLPLEQIIAGQVFVAERDNAIVGFAAVLPRTDGGLELDGLFVEPNIWKSGVGRALVEYCSNFGVSLGVKTLHVVGNPHAEGFYAACGFKVTGKHKTQFGIGLLMEKELKK